MRNLRVDWKRAEKYLDEAEKNYASLIGMPQCNPWFALGWIEGLRHRFEEGERTEDLYDDIMAIK